jgi:Domain of unknown function (DUF4349)
MKKILFSLLVLISLVGCKQNAEVSGEVVTEETVAVSEVNLPPKEKYDTSESIVVSDVKEILAEPVVTPKIIKNCNLRFETSDLEATFNQIAKTVAKNKANIQNDTQGTEYNNVFRSVVVRVPSENFEALLAEVSQSVSYFDLKEISSDDVTEEYIDIDARLKTKKVLETRYFELLKKASKISEIIEIEKQLSAIREEIESKEGQLKYLQNKVSMSTVTIHFYKTTAQKSGATVSFGTKIINAIVSGFNGISSFFIWLIEIWPFMLILVAIIYFIKKKFKKKPNL